MISSYRMSYDQKFKGKLVWGTSVWRIDLQTSGDPSKLKSDFSGTLILYERRHEKSKHKFKDLDQFINTVGELWKESLRSDFVQDTRMARWIEEYLSELGISTSYQEILDAIRGDFEEVPPLEVGEEEDLSEEDLDTLIPEMEDIMVSGTTRKIAGDLDDKDEVNQILDNFLIENKPERKTEAKSKASFTTPDGKEQTIEETKEIEDQPLNDDVTLNSGFNNDFGVPIEDIEFSDIVPYDYEIKDIKLSGVTAEKLGQRKTTDGLEVQWKIDKLEPGEKSEMEYELGKRMLRTILIRDDFDLTILQTYENINKEEKSVWIESTYIFQDQTSVVENVKILDQIPGEYQLVESKPDAVPPLAQVRVSNQSTEVSWSYTDVPAQTQFVVTYELGTSPRILRDKIQLLNQQDEIIANIVRILKPLPSMDGYGVIMAINAEVSLSQPISIQEMIPADYSVKELAVDKLSLAELQEGDYKKIVWKLDGKFANETVYAYLRYVGTSSYIFDKITIMAEDHKVLIEGEGSSSMKSEKISLPEDYYSLLQQ